MYMNKKTVLSISFIALIICNASACSKKQSEQVEPTSNTNIPSIQLYDSVYKHRNIVVVRKGGDDGVNTFRIPGIIQTNKGTLLSVYDIRYSNSGDLPGNIDVGLSRSIDSGKTWQPMKVIIDMGFPNENNGVGDPAILFDPITKKIFVIALWSKGNRSIAGSLPGFSPDTTGQIVAGIVTGKQIGRAHV